MHTRAHMYTHPLTYDQRAAGGMLIGVVLEWSAEMIGKFSLPFPSNFTFSLKSMYFIVLLLTSQSYFPNCEDTGHVFITSAQDGILIFFNLFVF